MRTLIQSASLLVALLISLIAHAELSSMRAPLFGSTDLARERAAALDASTLAPSSYKDAEDNYARAESAFSRGASIDSIRRYLNRAETLFNKASDTSRITAKALEAVIEARADARASDAESYAHEAWSDGESNFAQASRQLERGSIKSAERYAGRAEAAYRDSELTAIKANYLSETRDYIQMAEKLRAERYAPVSLNNARQLLKSAEDELNGNRYDTDRPRSLAADAKHSALHAVYVSKLEHRIRNREATLETILMSWESAIGRLGDALDTPVYFDYGEVTAIDALHDSLSRIQSDGTGLAEQLADRDAELLALRAQTAKMQELLGGGNQTIEELEVLLAEQKQRLEQQARHRERFATVESLFDSRQATVLRQGDTVIIRMIGLNFDSGAATLTAEHLQILDILERAISEFPESQVVVEGHTDAFGSDADNLNLSQARADSVVRHLLSSLPISPANLNALGYGESRPVANNETPEGRKRNRRIDVVIRPDWITQQSVAQIEPPDILLQQAQ